MSKHLLIPYDGSPQAEGALEFAAGEWPDAELTLLNVINPVEAGYAAGTGVPSGAEEWYERSEEKAETLLAEASEGHDVVDTRIEVGRPSAVVVEVCEETGCDHVVIGSHGRTGVSRILLGSVAESVVRKSPVPVTVVR